MKNYIFTFFALLLISVSHAQSVFHQVVAYPVTGFDELRAQYPYIVEQEQDSTGDWENIRKYSWAPAAISGYNAYNATHVWDNNEWNMQNLTTDSFVMNTDGTIFKVFEIEEYNYSGIYVGKEKYKHTFTYDSNKRITSMKTDKTPNASSNTYQSYYLIKSFYDNNGRRDLDSTTYYQSNFKFLTRYTYDNNNNMTTLYNIRIPSGDTIYRMFYSYHNNKVKTIYGEGLNETSGALEPQSIDSITFENDRPVRRIRYGMVSINGAEPVFQPNSDDRYTYNNDGTLSTEEEKFYMNGDWSNSGKKQFLYGSGKPTIGYLFRPNASGVYEATASGRYLFTAPSGIRNETGRDMIGNLYPNPASDHLQLTLNDRSGRDATYFIYDHTGRLVLTAPVSQHDQQINLDGLVNGVYILNVVSDHAVSARKFTISK